MSKIVDKFQGKEILEKYGFKFGDRVSYVHKGNKDFRGVVIAFDKDTIGRPAPGRVLCMRYDEDVLDGTGDKWVTDADTLVKDNECTLTVDICLCCNERRKNCKKTEKARDIIIKEQKFKREREVLAKEYENKTKNFKEAYGGNEDKIVIRESGKLVDGMHRYEAVKLIQQELVSLVFEGWIKASKNLDGRYWYCARCNAESRDSGEKIIHKSDCRVGEALCH